MLQQFKQHSAKALGKVYRRELVKRSALLKIGLLDRHGADLRHPGCIYLLHNPRHDAAIVGHANSLC